MIYLFGIMSTIAWVWLIVTAFKAGQTAWGVVMILFVPACFLYGILNWSKAATPFILLVVSVGLFFTLPSDQIAQLKK